MIGPPEMFESIRKIEWVSGFLRALLSLAMTKQLNAEELMQKAC
jgi:hypothetical protein